MRAGSYNTIVMNKYLFLYKDDESKGWSMIEDKAPNKMAFLDQIDDSFLKYDTWVVYNTPEVNHKEGFVHSGHIDELIDDR